MQSIIITGSKGQLGQAISEWSASYPNFRLIECDVDEVDITDAKQLNDFLLKHPADFLVNCAAYTAVDDAEDDVEMAMKVNAHAVNLIAEACNKYNIRLIHVSTDYVFDGTNHKPYLPTDATSPVSVYGRSKLDGEINLAYTAKNAIIIRTSWLYSHVGKNFVKTILKFAAERGKLKVVSDQVGTPTYAPDIAKAILEIIENYPDFSGVKTYHYSNEGVASWYDFAYAAVEFAGINCTIDAVNSDAFPTKAKRPFYSVLDKNSFKEDFDQSIPYWKESLKTCIRYLKEM